MHILEFYLDKSILKPCIDMDKTIKCYANAVSILARELPHLKYTDSHAQTAIRMTRLFREDQVLEAFETLMIMLPGKKSGSFLVYKFLRM